MLTNLRSKLTYSNLISTIALFAVVGGGTAFAAIGKNTVGSKQIKRNAVKGPEIAKNAVKGGELHDSSVGTTEVIDDSLVGADINESTLDISQPSSLPPSGPAGGDLTGNYPTPLIANNKVNSSKIADGTVNTLDLASNAVNSAKIADGSVNTADLTNNAVNSAKVADNSLTSSDIEGGAVRASELAGIVKVQTNGTVANNSSANLHASCPAGSQLVSGGGGINLSSPPAGVALTASTRFGDNVWRIVVRNDSGAARTVFAEAYCLVP